MKGGIQHFVWGGQVAGGSNARITGLFCFPKGTIICAQCGVLFQRLGSARCRGGNQQLGTERIGTRQVKGEGQAHGGSLPVGRVKEPSVGPCRHGAWSHTAPNDQLPGVGTILNRHIGGTGHGGRHIQAINHPHRFTQPGRTQVGTDQRHQF